MQWVEFCVAHIVGKMENLPKDYLGGRNVSKEEFIVFIKKVSRVT